MSLSARSGIITLTTDFGQDDAFVGVMKGVIAGINPSARVTDLTHSIPPFDVLQAAFRLRQAYPYFPKATVHVAVVDPGVGGERRIVAMESDGHLFLAPDNGTLAVVEEESGRAELVSVTEPRFFRPEVSASFHGRDIFAPVAAHLAGGTPLSGARPGDHRARTVEFPEARVQRRRVARRRGPVGGPLREPRYEYLPGAPVRAFPGSAGARRDRGQEDRADPPDLLRCGGRRRCWR